MPRILLTGFEPFGGSRVNPSAVLVGMIAAEGIPGASVAQAVLPVVGGASGRSAFTRLLELVTHFRPEAIVMLGEAATASHIQFERVAINVRDDRIPDNEGVQLRDTPIVVEGPAAYFSTLPVREMRDACEGEGVPAVVSNSAGSFLCNELMYRILHSQVRGEMPVVRRAGFVHVPQLPEQAATRGGPSMRAEHVLVGLRASLLGLVDPLA